VPTPVTRPPWLKVTTSLALAGIVAWPVLAMLGLLGVIPGEVVLNLGIVTAVLAYISIRRIKRDREIALGQADPGPGPGEQA
jgi:xanthosine utilization system XapX-like protein